MRVIFTSSNLPAALAIRFFTGCRWHHCGIIYENQGGDPVVIESRAIVGVQAVTLQDFKNRGDWCIIDYDVADSGAAERFLYSQLGKPYDWGGAIAYPFRGDWQDRKKWYCSELVAATFEQGKSPIVRQGVRSITPRDLFINPCGKMVAQSL